MCAILVVIPILFSVLLALGTTSACFPLLYSYLPIHQLQPENRSARQFFGPRAILSLVPVGACLFALSYIPLPESLGSSDTTTAALTRLIVLGTIILGLLSGFGAVSSSWQFLPIGNRNKYVLRSSLPSDSSLTT